MCGQDAGKQSVVVKVLRKKNVLFLRGVRLVRKFGLSSTLHLILPLLRTDAWLGGRPSDVSRLQRNRQEGSCIASNQSTTPSSLLLIPRTST